MSKKAIFITFVSAIVVVFLVGILSFWIARNQPSADVATPPTPPVPADAPKEPVTPLDPQGATLYPPVPPAPLLSGDTVDDGIVDVLDINALIVHWGETNVDYNLADETNDKGVINVLDLGQAIKYWKCFEGREGKDCPYREASAK